MNILEEFEHKGVSVKIVQDEDAQSPQEDGDRGLFIIANHRDFYVPPPGEKRISGEWECYVEMFRRSHWIFPLEAYIHSGVRLAFGHEGNFPDRRWDVSQVGGVFVSKKEWRLSAKARKAAASYIETWNLYLSGEVCGYIVDEAGEDESCWGFYGQEYCAQSARSIAEHIAEKRIKEAAEAQRWACADVATVPA